MEELDHSGFVLDEHQIKFETLDSKVAKGIVKIILSETQYKTKCPMLTVRQIMCQIFSFSTSIKLTSRCAIKHGKKNLFKPWQ